MPCFVCEFTCSDSDLATIWKSCKCWRRVLVGRALVLTNCMLVLTCGRLNLAWIPSQTCFSLFSPLFTIYSTHAICVHKSALKQNNKSEYPSNKLRALCVFFFLSRGVYKSRHSKCRALLSVCLMMAFSLSLAVPQQAPTGNEHWVGGAKKSPMTNI